MRRHQILDPPRVALTLKIRGGAHTARDGDLASCTMMTLEPGGPRGHPVPKRARPSPYIGDAHACLCDGLVDNQWFGLKLVRYWVGGDATKVVNRLYVDTAPFALVMAGRRTSGVSSATIWMSKAATGR